MLNYLSGVEMGAPKRKAARQAAKTAKVEAKAQRKEIKQVSRQKRVTSAAKFVTKPAVKVLKAVAKQSKVAAQKIQKNRVAAKQRKAFKKAGEPAIISPENLQSEAEETYNMPVEVEAGTEEVNEEEFNDSENSGDDQQIDDFGLIYPGAEISGKKKAARQTKKANKKATKAPAKAIKKAKRADVLKKVGGAALNIAKATLEAKGIKFPTKEQIETEATKNEPEPKQAGGGYIMPIIIGGAALALFLIMKKK